MLTKNTEDKNIAVEKNASFFKKHNINFKEVYKNGQYIDLEDLDLDILFYDQPWDIPFEHNLCRVSEFALTMYSPYSIQIVDYKKHYIKPFHKYLYKYFVEDELNIKRFEKYQKGASKNCEIVGYPKLDTYLEKSTNIKLSEIWKEPDKFKIIYAPHHSFGNFSTTGLGTFLENGKFILELAKSHPETTWVFKPHPWFKYNIISRNKIMTKEEYNDYISEWKKIGNIVETGDYFDIFKSSDLMITDSGSFLGEYLPSKKPLIRLINKNANIGLNEYGKLLFSEYYNSYNNNDLEELFNEIVVKKNDYKKEKRIKLIEKIFHKGKPASEQIYASIINSLSCNKGEKND